MSPLPHTVVPAPPLTAPGWSHSCSKHDGSLCPISVTDVSKYASLLCPLADTVKTHPPCACLSQSRIPEAHLSCLFTSVSAIFKPLTISSLSRSVPDTSTHSSRCLGPNACPPSPSPCQSQLPCALPRVRCQSLPAGYAPFIHHGRNWGKDLPEENGLCSDLGGEQGRQFPLSAAASGPRALSCPPSSRTRAASSRSLGQGRRYRHVY